MKINTISSFQYNNSSKYISPQVKKQSLCAGNNNSVSFQSLNKVKPIFDFKSIFSFKPKDVYLTKEEVFKSLNKKTKKHFNLILEKIQTPNGYSKAMLNSLLGIYGAFNSFNLLTQSRICHLKENYNNENIEYNKNLLKNIELLANTKYDAESVSEILDMGYCEESKTYNQKTFDLAISNYKEFKKDTKFLLDAATPYNGKIQEDVFNFFAQKVRNNEIKPKDSIAYSEVTSYKDSDGNPQISIQALNKAFELEKLLGSNNMYKIMHRFNEYYEPPTKRFLASLTEDLPQNIKDKEELCQFILYRISATRDKESRCSDINPVKYKLFNRLYERYQENEKLIHINNITNYAGRNFTSVSPDIMTGFCLIASEYLEIEELSDCIREMQVTEKNFIQVLQIINLLKPEEKSSFNKVLEYFRYYKNEPNNYSKILSRFNEQYQLYKDSHGAKYIAFLLERCTNPDGKFNQEKFNTLIKIEDEKNLSTYLSIYANWKNKTEQDFYNNVKLAKQLLDNGFDSYDIGQKFIYDKFKTYQEKGNFNKIAIELKNKYNLSGIKLLEILRYNTDDEVNQLMDLRNDALKRRDQLQLPSEELTDAQLNEVFVYNYRNVLNTLQLASKEAVLYSFAEKLDNVENYFEIIGNIPRTQVFYERLVEIINPGQSQRYKNLSYNIKLNKDKLSEAITNEEKQEIIKKINTLTKERKELSHSGIKDPKSKLEAAYIAGTVYEAMDNNGDVSIEEILPYMNPKTEEDRETYYQKLNEIIFRTLGMEQPSEKVIQRLNFRASKYLPKLFNVDGDFCDSFSVLIDCLSSNPDKSNEEIFNQLPQNKLTHKLFKKYRLNYTNWVRYNPNSKIELEIKTDIEKQKQSAIKNLESDINDEIFKVIPTEEKSKLVEKLNSKGIELQECDEALYEGDGFLSGKTEVLRLYKNKLPIEFEDLAEVISTIKTELNENEFWNTKNKDEKIENAKETFKNHILKLRYNEVKRVLENKSDKVAKLTIQKADMNDIPHSLFLGNDACCCTAIGSGFNMWTAPNYIMNKLISCIEIKNGNNSVGNTMMFTGIVDGELSLILDNVELKPQYQFNNNIRDAIFRYTSIITQELGQPNMKIYAGPNRHKLNMEVYPLEEHSFKIIGVTGENEIYLDFETEAQAVNPDIEFDTELYRIR